MGDVYDFPTGLRRPVLLPVDRSELVQLCRAVLVASTMPGASPERAAELFTDPEDAA